MNLPNLLTLLRIFIVPLLVVVLLTRFSEDYLGLPQHIAGLTLFLIAAITDALDGWIARRQGQVSAFGTLLDPIADKLLISSAFISLVENGLAPAWATRVPTVSERRWVTACLLSRTNVNGVPVKISMRHDANLALLTSAAERATYTEAEGAFYGDLFAPIPVTFACSNRAWTPLVGTFRACALSPNGITTDCTFTYTGACTKACGDKTAPFNGCKGLGTSYNEVATIFLTPTQQAGDEL